MEKDNQIKQPKKDTPQAVVDQNDLPRNFGNYSVFDHNGGSVVEIFNNNKYLVINGKNAFPFLVDRQREDAMTGLNVVQVISKFDVRFINATILDAIMGQPGLYPRSLQMLGIRFMFLGTIYQSLDEKDLAVRYVSWDGNEPVESFVSLSEIFGFTSPVLVKNSD